MTKKIENKFINYLSLFLGFSFIIGIAFASNSIWNVNNSNIPQKIATNSVSSDEFNRIIYTLKNIYNDGSHIGINQPNPESTLDINGDLTVRNINGKDGNYAAFGCSTLGTNNGKFECHSSYHWDYASWGACSKVCNTGTHTRTSVCKRDDNQTVNNSYCTTAPILSENCNTSTCNWSSGGWSTCTKSCGTGSQSRSVTCKNPNNSNTTVANSLCLSSKPTTSRNCNTQGCSYSITYKRTRSTYEACSPCTGPEGKCSWYSNGTGTNKCKSGYSKKLTNFENEITQYGSCTSNISMRTPGKAKETLTYECY